MNDYSELERLAEAATPGPWSFDGPYVCPARVEDGATYVETWRQVADCHQPENTKFIAAANPATVLELIDENKAMAEFKEHMIQLRETHGFESWSAALVEVDRLKAENEALRKDAERYRWLRDSSESIHQFYLSTPIWFTGVKFSKENVDSTIDAAMSKETDHDQP